MEEFIYIILGVLWLAATIYRASKKKQQPTQKQPAADNIEEESHTSATQSLLEQLLEGQQLRVPEPEIVEMEEPYAEPMMAEVEERKSAESFKTQYAGYGFKSMIGEKIFVDEEAIKSTGSILFYASVNKDNNLVKTTSSRSLAVVGVSDKLNDAEKICEDALQHIDGDHIFIRHDIGKSELIDKRIKHMVELRGM